MQKKTPVQRSPLSATAHTHPVYCMKVVGTQNAHNLISISTDGRLCSWSLDMLSQPQETLELQQQKQSRVSMHYNYKISQCSKSGKIVQSKSPGAGLVINYPFF